MIACTQRERTPGGRPALPGGQGPCVVPVLANIGASSAGKVVPKVANIRRPSSRTKPTRSNGNGGDYVEVADNLPEFVAVRDSKNRTGAALTFGRAAWQSFIDDVKTGQL